MGVHTLIEIRNQTKTIICRYMTNRFTEESKRVNIVDYILRKSNGYKPPFDIHILDQHNGYITLDDDFLEEFNPFATKKLAATTVQTTTSSEPNVKLRITLLSDCNLASTLDQSYQIFLNEIFQTIDQQHEQTQGVALVESTIQSSNPVTARLFEDSKMGFVTGHNVNNKQRDQYICDQVCVDTGENTGTLSMIQGQKNDTNKYQRVLPRFRIPNDKIQNRIDHVWTLLVYLVLDVNQSGKHSLFYHSERTFVTKDNLTQSSNPYEIPITTDDWMDDIGLQLKLITVVIEGAKKHHALSRKIVCNLDDIDGNGSSSDYSKSCLALVLRQDNNILWETLVLSNEMVFGKNTTDTFQVTNLLNPPKNTSIKRSRSKKCQNSSNKRSKTQVANNPSTTVQLFTGNADNNEFSILFDQHFPVHYNKSQATHSAPITTPNISAASSHIILNSTQTNNMFEDATSTINLLSDDVDLFINTDTDDTILINGDPLFNGIDLPGDDT